MSINSSAYQSDNTNSIIVAKQVQYSDIDIFFLSSPIDKDILRVTDINAVKNAVKNILLIDKFEVPFNPDFGAGIKAQLFNPCDPFTANNIKDRIETSLSNYEPRVNNVKVRVTADPPVGLFYIDLQFNIIQTKQLVELAFVLERIK